MADRPATRFGGLDVVRAAAMLLGIGYHASFAYVPGIGPWYLVQDVSTDVVFGTLGSVLHAARMQVFFVLAGFFAHLVAERGDLRAFVRDRARRLLVPLLVAAPLLVAFDRGAQAWAEQRGLIDASYRGHSDGWARPLYLWFLEYAFLFSLACWPLRGVRIARVRWPEGLLLGALLTFAARWALGEATPAFSFVPQLASVAHYGPFFALGWLLWAQRETLAAFRRCWWLGPVGLGLACWVYSQPLQWQTPGYLWGALSTWAMVLGALALAVRMPGAPVPGVRWLVEASYWVYLAHYPVVVSTQLLLAREPWPAWVKFTVVVTVASVASVASYALLIRRSLVGRWLTPSVRN